MKFQQIFVLCLAVSSGVVWGQVTTHQTVTRSSLEENLFHIQGRMIINQRHAPRAGDLTNDRSLLAFGTAVHWQPKPWVSLGPLFRGLSSFDSGTDTTRVTNTVNALGLSFDVFPLSTSLFASGNLHARTVLSGGILYSIESITFSHQLIAKEHLNRTVSSWVFPLEAGGELIMWNVTMRGSVGYSFFAQSQDIYISFGLGILI